MLLAAAVLASSLQQAVSPGLQDFKQKAEATLLSGGALQPDYRQQVLAMTPADRVEAIIYLRRLGLFTGQAWQIGDLLRPAEDDSAAGERKDLE